MKFLFDINHPAHVHYAKLIIKNLISKGHDVCITARNRPPVFELLRNENISFIDRGKGSNSMLGKIFYFAKGDYILYKKAKNFNPDLLICFMSPYATHVSKLVSKPCIILDDTEHAKLHDYITYPFSDTILTPTCFKRDLGPKQIRFDSFLELNYLHPKVFRPNKRIFDYLKIKENQKYVLLRFVAWGGHHDVGHKGISDKLKLELVSLLEKKYKVFISAESKLPDYFEKYRVPVPSNMIHDVLAYAELFIGESGTMANECAVLGTPAIYINSLPLMGYLQEAEKNGMIFHFSQDLGVKNKLVELLNSNSLKNDFTKNKLKHINDKIDGVSFFTWFFEEYPQSKEIMIKRPEYQYTFKRK